MKLIKALLESIKQHERYAIKYKGRVYEYDPYGFEKAGTASRYTEFRCNIGSFGEMLLSSHPDFNPGYIDFFADNQPELASSDERKAYSRKCLENMHDCENYEIVSE